MISDSGQSRKPTGRETRKRLAVGIALGAIAGLAAVVFSNSVAFGVLLWRLDEYSGDHFEPQPDARSPGPPQSKGLAGSGST